MNLRFWRGLLIVLFALSGSAMLAMTIWASLDRAVWNAGDQLLSDRWFQATLLDAYLGFLTFYAWVFYLERSVAGRVIWFVLIMCLGNMAISSYVVLRLLRWDPADGWSDLLLSQPQSADA